MQFYIRSINSNHLKDLIEESFFDMTTIFQNTTAILLACSVCGFECDDDTIRFEDARLDDLYMRTLEGLRRGDPVIPDYILNSCEVEERVLKDLSEYIDAFFNECVSPKLINSISVGFNHQYYWEISIKGLVKDQKELNVSVGLESHQLPRTTDSREVILGNIRRELTCYSNGHSPIGSY